jgi:hypothetical protein
MIEVTDEAARAAIEVFDDEAFMRRSRLDSMRAAITAALAHLTTLDAVAYERAFQRGVLIGKDEASSESEVFALLAAGIPIPASESTERERNAERRHREEIARALARPTLVADVEFETTGPTDYEVWRDALTMAATNVFPIGGAGDDLTVETDRKGQITADAEWFWERLGEVPVRHDPDDTPPPGPIPTTAPAAERVVFDGAPHVFAYKAGGRCATCNGTVLDPIHIV